MRILISVLIVFIVKIASAQNIEWLKSFDMYGMKFQHHSSFTYQNDHLLIGVKAIDTISPADFLNEIYINNVDATGNLKWSINYKPIDSVNCSEITLIKTYVNDSICIIIGRCYLSNISNTVYFYSIINLRNRSVNSFNLGLTSAFSLTSSRIENSDLILLKGIGISAVELMRINLVTNNSASKQINISGTYTYFNNYFYVVRDSILSDNSILFTISKIDTNGITVATKLFNSGLKVLSNGIAWLEVVNKNENLFVEGTYEYHLSNPTIIGNELDYFLIKFNPNNLQEIHNFVLSNQFPNQIKSKQEIEFDAQGDNTFIIAKVINDNNLRNVHSYLMSNNGIIWSKKLTEPSVNQLHKRFVNADILNNNNFVNLMSSLTGNITLANFNSAGTLIDSFDTKIDTNSASIDVQESFLNRNDNNIYLVGSHVIKSDNKLRLYIAKVNYLSTSTNFDKHTPINIYPNPSANTFTVDVNDVNTLTLYNSLGAKIKATSYTNIINVEDLPNGIYYLQILTKQNKHYSKKVIVQK